MSHVDLVAGKTLLIVLRRYAWCPLHLNADNRRRFGRRRPGHGRLGRQTTQFESYHGFLQSPEMLGRTGVKCEGRGGG